MNGSLLYNLDTYIGTNDSYAGKFFRTANLHRAPDKVASSRHKMIDKFLRYLWLTGLYYIPADISFPSLTKTCNPRRVYSYGVASLTVAIVLVGSC